MRYYRCENCHAEVASESVEQLVRTRVPATPSQDPEATQLGWARVIPAHVVCTRCGWQMQLIIDPSAG